MSPGRERCVTMRGSVENAFMIIHNPLVGLYQWLLSVLPEDMA